jgi:UDP-glucuronate 4-epimerase
MNEFLVTRQSNDSGDGYTYSTSFRSGTTTVIKVILLLCLFFPLCSVAKEDDPVDFLNKDSVIVITGAAGFLGSELALALHRTYNPKKILCVDRMGDHPATQEELAFFEFQRQRAFHVLQTLGAQGQFYRVDFRPMIPEYFDLGEVPVLDHIFREHPDISHIVHLADPYSDSSLQIVPREKEVPKAGMMEALMEQVRKQVREGKRAPHITYASSYEVYSFDSTETPLVETQPIGTPASLRGASKLIDEVLAKMYHDMYGIFSVGLRFFSVYGPWSVPGSPLFEMAERAVMGDLPLEDPEWTHIRDYLYIDDAVDAMMAAMQFRHENPVIFNVASGEGSTLQSIATVMEEYFPRTQETTERADMSKSDHVTPTVAFGSIERAQKILGFRPQISLREGVVTLLAWHYDRAFPYGGRQNVTDQKSHYIANKGIVSCMPNDRECLKAAPVFPCASECSHEAQCTPSFYDEIMGWTQSLTAHCETVLYTIDLDETLNSLASAHLKIRSTSKSFLEDNCNLAFVSKSSRLVQSLGMSNRMTSFMGGRGAPLKHGEWTLIPVNAPYATMSEATILSLLPKLSPSLFFGQATKRAIYVDPDVLLDNIPILLREASMQPYSEEMEGATAMLIGKGKPKDFFAQGDDVIPSKQKLDSTSNIVQNAAYRMVRIAVSDTLFGDGFMEMLDSRWMVHTLKSDDSRLFRCDVFGEVVQWEVNSDRSALEFVLGLHDMWSRVIASQSGTTPWWMGDGVVTVPEGRASHRRLEEEDLAIPDDDEERQGENVLKNEEAVDLAVLTDDETGESEEEDADAPQGGDEGGGFVNEGVQQQEVVAGEKNRGASSEQDDDQAGFNDDEKDSELLLEGRDFSSYDTWMGVLSASSVKYFVRIVPSSEVGVVSLEDYDKEKSRL